MMRNLTKQFIVIFFTLIAGSAFACDPIIVSVGSTISICNQSTVSALTGNNPAVNHTGKWTVVQGTGTFADDTQYNTSVSSVGQGDNIYRWTITNLESCTEYADLTVTNNTPSTPNAGTDGSSCNASYSLNGNIPDYGIGAWSVVSGNGSFVNSGLYNTVVSDLTGSNSGTTNVFRWTISSNGCSLIDDVTVTYYYPAVASVTTSPLTGCFNTSTLTLNGNNPALLTPVATGQWQVISGLGTFTSSSVYNTTVSNSDVGTNVYRWTLTRNGCTSSANVVVNNTSPSSSTAGSDQLIASSSTTLNGNIPIQGTGTWTISPTGPSITNVNLATSAVTSILENTQYKLIWTISNSTCPTLKDSMYITYNANTFGMVIQEDLTNDGSFIQTNDANYFIMNGTSKSIFGGLSSTNTFTDAKIKVMGTITFDGEIDNGKFAKTQILTGKTFTINNSRIYKNHLFENYGTTNINASSQVENSGNWINSATVVANVTSTVKFNGADVQEITSGWDGTNNAFGNLVIAQTVATPTATNGVILIDNSVIKSASSLTLTKGVVVIKDDDKMLIVNNPAYNAITGTYSDSWIYGTSENRGLRRYLATVNNQEYDFPVGTTTHSNLAVLNNRNLPSGTFYIDSYFKPSPANINVNFPATIEEDTILYTSMHDYGIWILKPTGTIAGSYDLKLYFNSFGIASSYDNLYGILKRPIGSSDGASWNIPLSNSHNIKKTVSSGFAHRTGISNFSEFGIVLGSSTLPISLLSFSLQCQEENTVIKWVTASEVNNKEFTLARSFDGITFEVFATIAGAGNSNGIKEYSFIDDSKSSNVRYYRLAQTDFDGTTKFFEPKAINCSNEPNNMISVFPNPFTNSITIKGNFNDECSVQICNAIGEIVFENNIKIDGEKTIDVSHYSPGLYMVKVIDKQLNKTVFKLTK